MLFLLQVSECGTEHPYLHYYHFLWLLFLMPIYGMKTIKAIGEYWHAGTVDAIGVYILRRMVSGMFSIFAYIMTAFLLICRWHLAAACCALGNQLYVALLKGGWNGSCFVGLVDTSFLQNFFPGLQDMLLSERLLTFSFGFGCFSLETRYRLKRFSRVV